MVPTLLNFFVVAAIVWFHRFSFAQVSEEYCQWETFNATCRPNHVLLITSALYGRMKVGRCIPFDYFVGCSTDVTDQLESKCSGRGSCVVPIPESEVFKVHPCRKDLVAYMDAIYTCIPVSGVPPEEVETPTSGSACAVNYGKRYKSFRVIGTSGYLSSYASQQSGGIGSESCPWLVSVPHGQLVEVTLYDFTDTVGDASLQPWTENRTCSASVRFQEDPSEDQVLWICPGVRERRKIVYRSVSNEVFIRLLNISSSSRLDTNLLLYFEATGCPDPVIPENSWSVRNGDTLQVACNFTSERWHLVCNGRYWVGNYNNCSKPATREEAPFKYVTRLSISPGLIVAVAFGVLIGIVLGLLLLVLLFNFSKRLKTRKPVKPTHSVSADSQQSSDSHRLLDIKFPTSATHQPSRRTRVYDCVYNCASIAHSPDLTAHHRRSRRTNCATVDCSSIDDDVFMTQTIPTPPTPRDFQADYLTPVETSVDSATSGVQSVVPQIRIRHHDDDGDDAAEQQSTTRCKCWSRNSNDVLDNPTSSQMTTFGGHVTENLNANHPWSTDVHDQSPTFRQPPAIRHHHYATLDRLQLTSSGRFIPIPIDWPSEGHCTLTTNRTLTFD